MVFGWRKRRAAPQTPVQATPSGAGKSPSLAAMKQAIADLELDNPMIRAAMTGKDLTASALAWFKDDRGVRVETVLGGLGALAGFCAVHDVAGRVAEGRLKAVMPDVAIVAMDDGTRYWSGEAIDAVVVEDRYSIWGVVGGMAETLGATDLPDLDEILRRVAGTLGSDAFDRPALPPAHLPGRSARRFARDMFPAARAVLEKYDLPRGQWPLAVALSIQEIMEMAKDRLAPEMMARIVMEMAIPASKLDPEALLATSAAA